MILAQAYLPHNQWEFWGLVALLLMNAVPGILSYLTGLKNHAAIKDVSTQVNGKVEQLLAVSKVADQATGRQQERQHYESLSADLENHATGIIKDAEAKALAILEAAEVKAREMLLLPHPPPEPEGETTVRKVRPS